jgi:putative addiction module component (TIGR02574 family)
MRAQESDIIFLVTTRQIVAAALKLPSKKRAELASQLIRSLDKEEEQLSREEWERLWAEEAERRLKELRQGKAKEIPAEEVFARARALRK